MAAGKNIEIKIAATGGALTAAEIEKVESALGRMDAMLADTGPLADESGEAMDGMTKATESLGEAADTVASTQDDLRDKLGKAQEVVGELGREMGKAGGSVGGFGRTLVGLAGGPIAIAVTAFATIVGLLNKWRASLDEWEAAQESATEAYDEYAQKFTDGIRTAQLQNEITAESAARQAEFAGSLADTLAAITGINDAIERNIALLTEQQQAENEIAAAKGKTALAEAGDDPVKKQQVANQLRKEAQEREIRQIEERRAAQQDLLDRREGEQAALDGQFGGVAEGKQAEAARLAAEAADAKRLADALREQAGGIDVGIGRNRSAAKQREKNELLANADQKDAEAASKGQQSKDLTAEAKEIAATYKAEVDQLVAAMNEIFAEINKLDRLKETRGAVFAEENKVGDINLDRTRKQAEEKQQREADRKAKAEDAERRKQEAEAGRREKTAAGLGREAVGVLPKGVSDKFRAAVEATAAGLQDGDQGGEIAKLISYMEQLAAATKNNRAVTEAQKIKIAQLEARLKDL
jgi:hypothetical protein